VARRVRWEKSGPPGLKPIKLTTTDAKGAGQSWRGLRQKEILPFQHSEEGGRMSYMERPLTELKNGFTRVGTGDDTYEESRKPEGKRFNFFTARGKFTQELTRATGLC